MKANQNYIEMYQYSAVVQKVVDGDTLEIDIDLGLSVWVRGERVRLYGVNTPEVYGVKKGSPEWDEGQKASIFVKEIVRKNDQVIVETLKDQKGKYGRYLVVIYIRLPETMQEEGLRRIGDFYCLNDLLLKKGLASEYFV